LVLATVLVVGGISVVVFVVDEAVLHDIRSKSVQMIPLISTIAIRLFCR
jgi:hypothetical protein